MSITAVSNNVTPVQTQKTTTAPVVTPEVKNNENTTVLGSDKSQVIKMERGFVPTLKGAGAGALGGGLIAGAPLALIAAGSHGEGAGWGMVFAMAAAAGGAAVGAVAGGVTANTTTSKGKGTLIGAGVGAATGAVGMGLLSLKQGRLEVGQLAVGAVLGAVAGAAAGFSGSLVAKHE